MNARRDDRLTAGSAQLDERVRGVRVLEANDGARFVRDVPAMGARRARASVLARGRRQEFVREAECFWTIEVHVVYVTRREPEENPEVSIVCDAGRHFGLRQPRVLPVGESGVLASRRD